MDFKTLVEFRKRKWSFIKSRSAYQSQVDWGIVWFGAGDYPRAFCLGMLVVTQSGGRDLGLWPVTTALLGPALVHWCLWGEGLPQKGCLSIQGSDSIGRIPQVTTVNSSPHPIEIVPSGGTPLLQSRLSVCTQLRVHRHACSAEVTDCRRDSFLWSSGLNELSVNLYDLPF